MLLATDLSLPTGVVVVLAVIALAEVALDVFALVDLYRRPVPQVAGGSKWIWVVIILLVNLIGAILYLAIARKPPPAVEAPRTTDRPAEQIGDIVDDLYGPRAPR